MLLASFATAYAGGTPKKIKNGVIKKPPPTPNKPERTPTNALNKSISTGLTKTCAIGRNTSIKIYINIEYYSYILMSIKDKYIFTYNLKASLNDCKKINFFNKSLTNFTLGVFRNRDALSKNKNSSKN